MPAQVAGNLQNRLVWKPPRVLKSDVLPAATVPKEMVKTLRVSDLTIALESTDMKKVQRRFGGTFGAEGDAGDSLEWLCLRGGDAAGRWVLWLKSGEMDDGTVGSFQWRRVPRDAKFDERCGVLSKADDRVELPIALRLGMSEADVLDVLGQPTGRYGNTLLYVHKHEGLNNNQEFTALNTVSVVVRDGAVWAIEVLKVSMS
jgi:hypothetical protein